MRTVFKTFRGVSAMSQDAFDEVDDEGTILTCTANLVMCPTLDAPSGSVVLHLLRALPGASFI